MRVFFGCYQKSLNSMSTFCMRFGQVCAESSLVISINKPRHIVFQTISPGRIGKVMVMQISENSTLELIADR